MKSGLGCSKNVIAMMPKWFVGISIVFILARATLSEPQFRSQQTEEFYNQPFNRPSTSRPQDKYAFPNYRAPSDRFADENIKYDDQNRNRHHTDNVRYRGSEYQTNERGGPIYGTRERDRLRLNLNYNQFSQDNIDLEFRNTIFDRWRPDLQGEKRPGETPGLNLPLAEDVFVSTDTGKLQGFYVYLYDVPGNRPDERPANKPLELQRHFMNVTVFLGVPYAQPPYNEGRFKPPRRVHNWHTTWTAIDYSPACPQNLKYVGASMGIRSGIDEDCLYLNIFTPSLSVNARERYPVMFYIHGGDFDHGSGSQFPAHMLSAWGETVVVTINYRLGALGFLSTGDYHSPGNYGLMDMAMAIEWVYNNIRFFNGDRDRITVFGPGAGGAAAGLLAVVPKTRDWVRQVIAESGSPLAEWAAIDDPYRVQNTSRVFGLEMGCNVDTSYNLLHCLVNRDYEELATAPITPDVGTFPWSPVVDGNFTVPEDSWYEEWSEKDWHILPKMPLELYKNNEHHRFLRYLTGVNRDEAADFVYNDIRLSQNNYVVTESFFNDRIRDWVRHYNYTLNPEGAYEAIKWKYTFWPDPHNTTHIREQYIHFLSDALYKSGVDQMVKLLVNSTSKYSVPTYYYMLNTTVEALRMPLWREVPNNLEYYFISGAPFMDPEFYPERLRVGRQQWTEGDRNISQFMMKTFANFAKWGNPTQEQVEPIRVNWEATIEGALKYLSINNTFNTTIHYNYRQTESTFWYEYMPSVVKEYVPTPPPPRNPWIDMKEPVTATMYALLAVVVAFLVILCVCLGLWKSAKRQRNKALDDLSYYSTENLTLNKDEDFEVRSYLDKLNSIRNNNATSRSGTLNTVLSEHQSMHSSRPMTPSTTGVSTNGRVFNSNIAEHDNDDHFGSKSLQSTKLQPLLVYSAPPKSIIPSQEKPTVVELEEPNRVISEHGQMSYKNDTEHNVYNFPIENQPKGFINQNQAGLPELLPYSEGYSEIPINSNVITTTSPLESQRMETLQQPLYAQPHVTTRFQPAQSQHQNDYDSQPCAIARSEHAQPQHQFDYETQPNNQVGQDPQRDAQIDDNLQRPLSPAAVTFGISMKPSRSVGTISSASGLILNTDL